MYVCTPDAGSYHVFHFFIITNTISNVINFSFYNPDEKLFMMFVLEHIAFCSFIQQY